MERVLVSSWAAPPSPHAHDKEMGLGRGERLLHVCKRHRLSHSPPLHEGFTLIALRFAVAPAFNGIYSILSLAAA